MSEILIKVEGVSKKFCKDLKTGLWYGLKDIVAEILGIKGTKEKLRRNEFWAIRDVSFTVRRGECLGLIGHNGAGKSTMLKMLNGLIKPDSGRVEMHGRVGALIELGAGFNPVLTGRENVYINGAILGFSKSEVDAKLQSIIEFADIEEFIDTPVQYYSSGMKVRLGFAVAAQMEPDILLIDEVLAVGDLGFQVKCYDAIGRLSKKTAIVFVSHSMPQIARISNKIMLLSHDDQFFLSNDISIGIDKYYRKFKTGSFREIINGDIRVVTQKMIVNGNADLAINEFFVEGLNQFQFNWMINNPTGYLAYIKVILFSQDFRPLLDCNSKESNIFIHPTRINTISLKLDPIYLRGGKYSFSLLIADLETDNTLLRIDYLYPFIVKSNMPSWADFRQIGVWEN